MALTIGSLEANLREARKVSANDTLLVASIFGNRIYYKGRLWRILYWFLALLGFKTLREKKLLAAQKKTDEAFKKYQVEANEAARRYQAYLAGESQEVRKERRLLTRWHALTKEHKRYAHLIALEAATQTPIPAQALLREEKTEEVTEWIAKVKGAKVTARKLHQACCDLIALTTGAENPERVATLEKGLIDLKLPVFSQKDPKHIAWREKLKSGDTISHYTLGEQIKAAGENHRVFTLQNAPNQLLVIGINRAVMPLRKLYQEQMNAGLREARIYQVDPQGRFAIVEKLARPLIESPRQWAYAQPLAAFLKWLVAQEVSLAPFHLKDLYLDQSGSLRSAKFCYLSAFDYVGMVDFVKEYAQGNVTLFRTVMHESGLSEHRYIHFFRSLVVKTLEENPLPVADLAALHEIADPKIVKRAKVLKEETHALKEKLEKAFPRTKDRLRDLFVEVYDKSQSVTFLWPSFEETLLQKILQ